MMSHILFVCMQRSILIPFVNFAIWKMGTKMKTLSLYLLPFLINTFYDILKQITSIHDGYYKERKECSQEAVYYT